MNGAEEGHVGPRRLLRTNDPSTLQLLGALDPYGLWTLGRAVSGPAFAADEAMTLALASPAP